MAVNTIIWDLGGVLVDWSPYYVFSDAYFGSEEKKKYFFDHICTHDWNEQQDAGRSIVEATQELVAQYPDWEKEIRDYYGRWTEMLRGPVQGTVELFRELIEKGGYRHYALTNWQQDLFSIALVRYNFLHWFNGRVVSGVEKTRKPFPEFYRLLLDRYEVDPAKAVFIDDNIRNVKAAEELGITGIHFRNPEQLRVSLREIAVY